MNPDVIVYTTEYCGYCVRAKSLLKQKGIEYREVRVDEEPEIRAWLVKKSGQRTVPQIFVNGRSVGGFTDLAAADRSGELQKLLVAPPVELDAPKPG